MFTSTLRSMVAHKLRLLLTTASIALGIAFLAGTLVLTDTMGLAFDQLFGKVSSGTDAVVRTKASYVESSGIDTSRAPISAAVIDDVRDVDGVRVAEGFVSGYALLTDNEGKAILTAGGAPTLGYTMAEDEALRGDVDVLSGTAPDRCDRGGDRRDQRRGERHRARLDHQGAVPGPDAGVHRGRHRRLRRREGPRRRPRRRTSTPRPRRRCSARPAPSTPSVSPETTGSPRRSSPSRLDDVVPAGAEAVTGATVSKENADAIKDDLKIVGVLFTVFAGIALFVGAFIIWNTFTMIITQRTREIALMRAIGATRRQVLRSLLLEAMADRHASRRRSGSASASPWRRDSIS